MAVVNVQADYMVQCRRQQVRAKLAYLLELPNGRAPERFHESERMTVEIELTTLPTELQSLIWAYQVRADLGLQKCIIRVSAKPRRGDAWRRENSGEPQRQATPAAIDEAERRAKKVREQRNKLRYAKMREHALRVVAAAEAEA